jgi:DNA-binding Lrp family transcriptional regulator
MKVLSEECGLSLAQTRKCIAKLEEAKLVRRYKRIRSYGQTSNIFALDLSLTLPAAKSPPALIECPDDLLE